uniref:Uncharacterized protein n=1 Tax=Branchiostoma floridae TaxID=7739 RepID=C3Z3I7_BRAFL|eukprot:XP_002597019.1 hypothetical protein BRAFLDRAFT_76511 [Branchiostoma floridae]
MIFECVCEDNYCNAGVCKVVVDKGPECECPSVLVPVYHGDRCSPLLTQAAVIGIGVGCVCAVLIIIVTVVKMARRARKVGKNRQGNRYRPGGLTIDNYGTYTDYSDRARRYSAMGQKQVSGSQVQKKWTSLHHHKQP